MSKIPAPSVDLWLKEAKDSVVSGDIGMYLLHNGVVRKTSKASLSDASAQKCVSGMEFSYDAKSLELAIKKASLSEGIKLVRVWMNSGSLNIGDDLMYVLVGGDTRSHVFPVLQDLVKELKTSCVREKEFF